MFNEELNDSTNYPDFGIIAKLTFSHEWIENKTLFIKIKILQVLILKEMLAKRKLSVTEWCQSHTIIHHNSLQFWKCQQYWSLKKKKCKSLTVQSGNNSLLVKFGEWIHCLPRTQVIVLTASREVNTT